MALSIKWNNRTISQLNEAIEYIEIDSPVNAEKLKKDILLTIDGLLQHPEKYNPDKYKAKNDGSFRAFELHHYRVSYRYKGTEIRIINTAYKNESIGTLKMLHLSRYFINNVRPGFFYWTFKKCKFFWFRSNVSRR
ncbi:MAG: type II toxin-antitoxin system RelE/ParE family toxin [Chitinophagaceae bacterium]|jgi:plasmid stabilization system protein ParE|nr:type II toxin-antitoxin system RelE/ParE family toxin [Chitinophagaceae bacterium]